MLEYQQAECFESDGREFAKEATCELQLAQRAIPNSFRACLLRKLFSHRDFPVQFAVRAVGTHQGGESS